MMLRQQEKNGALDMGRRRHARRLRRAAIGCVLLALAFAAVVWAAGSLLSAPCNAPIGLPPSDLQAKPVTFASESGSAIHAWYLSGRKGRGVVILAHPLRESRRQMVGRARFLNRAGYGVLLFDFQAHGESQGRQITFGFQESRDVQAAVAYVRKTASGERVGLIGISLGGAATLLAQPIPQLDAVVLEMVYPDIEQAITDRLTMRLGLAGRALTPLLAGQIQPRLGFPTSRLRPIDHVSEVRAPTFVIAGEKDLHTRLDESRRMFAAAREPKQLWIVPGATHCDLHAFATDEYERRVLQFFGSYLR